MNEGKKIRAINTEVSVWPTQVFHEQIVEKIIFHVLSVGVFYIQPMRGKFM